MKNEYPNPVRRQALQQGIGLALAGVAGSPVFANTPASSETSRVGARLDLVVTGGRVIDPAQQIDQPLDIGIRKGRIAELAPRIDTRRAGKVHDASGQIVTAGLIDMHAHVADAMMPVSIDPDVAGIPTGVTTFVDAGSAGARTLPGFRKHIIRQAETRIYALLNISAAGLVVTNELYLDPKLISIKRALRAIRDNRDILVGLKARVRGRPETLAHDINVMKTVRMVADETGLPTMMHWTNEPTLLDMLRPGDLMTHPFNPAYLNPSCVGPDGRIYPQILELPDRGIGVDLGHGSSFDWNIAEKAAEQGWYPDVLSTDMFTRYFRPNGVVGDIGQVMSKFLYLGLSLEQAIEKVTAAPTRVIPLPEELGSLRTGRIADLTILTVKSGRFEFTDSPRLKQQRTGKQLIQATATIKSGRVYAHRY